MGSSDDRNVALVQHDSRNLVVDSAHQALCTMRDAIVLCSRARGLILMGRAWKSRSPACASPRRAQDTEGLVDTWGTNPGTD